MSHCPRSWLFWFCTYSMTTDYCRTRSQPFWSWPFESFSMHEVILGFGWLSIQVPLPMHCWSISLYTAHRYWPQGHFLINLPEAKFHYTALLSETTTSGIVFFLLDYQLPAEAVLFLPFPVVSLRLVPFSHLGSVEDVFLYNNAQCFHKFNSIK